jgi:hypothetical protein
MFMKRIVVAILAIFSLLMASGLAAAAVIPPGVNGPGLAAVGPVSATDGFPVWYKDNNGLRLEPCIAQSDPFCPARGPLPDETSPVSFPTNYPDEGFYDLADTGNLPSGNGGRARAVIALEQGFRNGPVLPGDQVTFARVRIKVSNLQDGVDYTFTTPAGVQTLQTSGKQAGLIFDTEDIGIGGVGDFTGALGGRIGPFLTWDTFPNDPSLKPNAAGKDTYVGDGATPHAITGSPYGAAFNVFRIQGPGINPNPTVDACPTVNGPIADCMETNLFTVQGKVATTSGVSAQQATYSRSSAGSGTVDVFASSESGPQSIQVSDVSPGGPEFNPTGLTGSNNGQFFSRVAYTGAAPPTTLQVTNTGDVPASNQRVNVVDAVSGTASYDTGTQLMTVNAVSSDTSSPRTLTVKGYGQVSAGTYTSGKIGAPPMSVTVTSDAGGSAVLPVQITGGAAAPISVAAQAGPDQTVSSGQLVNLDGSASTNAQTYSWVSPGLNLVNPTTATPSFIAPAPGVYTVTLTVTGPGGPSSTTVTITVIAATTAVANAGPNQTGVQRGSKVTLDGTRSTGAGTYAWTQTIKPGDPTVTLTGANTASPTFTFPFFKFPANTGPLTFSLTVTSPNGSSSQSQVTVTPTADTVAIAKGQYTVSNKQWRIDGSSNVLAGETVTAHLGGLDGPVLGSTIIEADGTFSIRTTTTGIVGKAGQTISIESQLGGTAAGFAIKLG